MKNTEKLLLQYLYCWTSEKVRREGEMGAAMKVQAAMHTMSDALGDAKDFISAHWRPILTRIGAPLLLAAAVAGFELYATYNHYAAVVTTRLSHQSLQRPAGIYAAPRRVSAGQQITREELKERLLRAGYLEGEQAATFASGSFVARNNTIKILTNEFARSDALPESVRITFSAKAKEHEQIAG